MAVLRQSFPTQLTRLKFKSSTVAMGYSSLALRAPSRLLVVSAISLASLLCYASVNYRMREESNGEEVLPLDVSAVPFATIGQLVFWTSVVYATFALVRAKLFGYRIEVDGVEVVLFL